MPPSSTATPNFVLVPDEPVEKFNAAEMSMPSRRDDGDERRTRSRHARGRTRAPMRHDAEVIDQEEPRFIVPTKERMAKDDVAIRTFEDPEDADRYGRGEPTMGPITYRAAPPIRRMMESEQLSPNPVDNYAMFAAAEKFEQLFYDSGLTQGVRAQDISRIVVHGGDAAARYMPQGEKQAHCRQQFRLAVKLMGYYEAHPHRGAGRLVIDVVCYDMGVEAAARKHMLPGRTSNLVAAGMDRLREGLFALAVHWRMI